MGVQDSPAQAETLNLSLNTNHRIVRGSDSREKVIIE